MRLFARNIGIAMFLALGGWGGPAALARADCGAPANAIVAENCLTGDPSSQWDIPTKDSGDPTLQGFATDISVNKGETVRFKIKSTSSSYTIDIYRFGYYGGNGARKIASVDPAVPYPQIQPDCLTDSGTALVDCGNWEESASWNVPADAVSGVYVARLARTDTGGASHILFIVRDDDSHSDLLFQTSDTSWQAYNTYGDSSFYKGPAPVGRAYKLSYNRPFRNRKNTSTQFFTHEYPMIRWLEANGYDVAYFTGVDTDRRGGALVNHKVFLSVGHDEYWSGNQRAQVENAQSAGVHMAFLSANEIYWKTRWENSIDGTNTPYRTLVCYKESYEIAPIDPQDPPVWTGTWRDPRFSPPADGGRPENAMKAQLYSVNAYRQDAITVSSEEGKSRFWRNTAVAALASGTSVSFPETMGYEWDEVPDDAFRPGGVIYLSSATYYVQSHKEGAAGSIYAPAWVTHHLTLFRHPAGGLVFGAGTMQWSWGLDNNHDHGSRFPPVASIQQATINLFAEMQVQPGSLQSGLAAASPSTDAEPPASMVTFPLDGGAVVIGSTVTLAGTATDAGGGVVAGVEVSVDGGITWHPASGRSEWFYDWFPTSTGTAILQSRAIDDSLNIEAPASGVTVIQANPVPVLAGLSPGSIGPGNPAFTLTVTGTNFVSGSMVQWNGNDRPTLFVDSATLSATIFASDVAGAGTAAVTVFNPAPGGGISNSQSFDVAIVCPCSIWPASAVPGNSYLDPSSLEVGVKFRSDVDGFITGIRFYKESFNAGAHTGHLWSSTGTLLASIAFSSESVSGWQRADLENPAPIDAGVPYVASYFTTTGYSVNQNYFASTGVDKVPLHALQSGVDGANGVFRYSPVSTFPTDSYLSSNYWVDVVFTTRTVPNPVPIIAGMSPAFATVAGSSFTLTLGGAGFISSSTVQWNGSDRPTAFVSDTWLTAEIPASDLAAVGTATVTVTNPEPGGGISNALFFAITEEPVASNPVPIITGLSPSSATVGGSGFTLTVNGADFIDGSTVQWNGSDRPTVFVSGAQVTVSIDAADIAAVGTASVTVTNPAPGGGVSNLLPFSILAVPEIPNPVPSLGGISPSHLTTGSPGFALTLNGSNFAAGSVVLWNGAERATTFVSSVSLKADIPASDLTTRSYAYVKVFTPPPGGGTSQTKTFTIRLQPSISSLSPASAVTGGPDFTLVINGTNFAEDSTVRWNGSSRSALFISSTQVSALIPSGDIAVSTTAQVTVFNPSPGGNSNALPFYASSEPVSAVPTLSSISPSNKTTGSPGFALTLNGSNFAAGSVVRWNGVERATTFVSSVSLKADIPASDLTTRSYAYVKVFTPPPGGGTSQTKTFTIRLQPSISSLSPASAGAGGPDFTLVINGTNFAEDSTVRWNGSSRSALFISSTQVSALIPSGDIAVSTTAQVTVYNPAPGGGSNAKTFSVTVGTASASSPQVFVNRAPSDFSSVRVYPNPWRSDGRRQSITFDRMPPGATVKIFSISGRWVRTLDASNGSVDWDLTNDNHETVASGFYLYLLTAGQGQKQAGKLAIIR